MDFSLQPSAQPISFVPVTFPVSKDELPSSKEPAVCVIKAPFSHFTEGSITSGASCPPDLYTAKAVSAVPSINVQNNPALAGSLSELHRFATEADRAYLESVVANPAYRDKFEQLMGEGYQSRLYRKPEVCDVLYWGLINGQLSDKQFSNHYFLATLNLCFFSGSLTDEAFNGIPDLADRITVQETKDGPVATLHLTTGFKGYIAAELMSLGRYRSRELDTARAKQRHLSFWLAILSENLHGITIAKDKSTITFEPFTRLLENAGKYREPPLQTLMPYPDTVTGKPTFGSGGWEELKKMREQELHPLAFWHPVLSGGILTPDRYWIGTLSVIHDLYHVIKCNGRTGEERQMFLRLDSLVYTSLKELCGRQVNGNPLNSDLIFKRALESLVTLHKGAGCIHDSKPAPDDFKRKMEEIEEMYRFFIDQEHEYSNLFIWFEESTGLNAYRYDSDMQSSSILLNRHFFFFQYLCSPEKHWMNRMWVDLTSNNKRRPSPCVLHSTDVHELFLWWKEYLDSESTDQ